MTDKDPEGRSKIVKLAWLVVGAVSAVLVAYGVIWLFAGPEMALTNIAERTSLLPEEFRQGAPSAFDVISVISRQFAVYVAAVGMLMLFVTWQGYLGSRWAWVAAWVLVATIGAAGLSFMVVSAAAYQGLMYLTLALVVAVSLFVARWGATRQRIG
jgi:hypothetical protein